MVNTSNSAILLYAVAGAVALAYVPYLPVAAARARIGTEALKAPRGTFDRLPAYAQRALWAHQNSFESMAVFAASALTAYAAGVDSLWATRAAIAYLGARLLYSVFYIADLPLARSLMFVVGTLGCGTLFVLSFGALNAP